MLKLYFNVTAEKVKLDSCKENDNPAAGNINYIQCFFELPTEYNDLIVEAVFNGERRLLVNGECLAPHIVAGECTVGVIAYQLENDSYKMLSSPNPCTVYFSKGSFTQEKSPPPPTPTVYEQLVEMATNAETKAQRVFQMAENGDFKGDKGDPGKNGAKGDKGDKGDPGTTTYTELTDKPTINGFPLSGNISLSDINAQSLLDNGKLKDFVFVRMINDVAEDGVEDYGTPIFEKVASYEIGEYLLFFLTNIYTPDYSDSGQEEIYSGLYLVKKISNEGSLEEQCEINSFDTSNILSLLENRYINRINRDISNLMQKLPAIDNRNDRVIMLQNNCEHRRIETGFYSNMMITLELPNQIPADFISSLIFIVGDTAISFSYPRNIIFTGDDVVGGVFVPKANMKYQIMFWYDGLGVNAISRGVPYAQT